VVQRRVIILAVVLLLAGCNQGGPAVVIQTTKKGLVRVRVEIARTQEEQSHGLMYRTSLPEDHGMLFLFPEEIDHSFWMKNTLIPLDMIFIGADGRIAGIHAKATPLSQTPISVGKPSRWVLEMNGGWAAYHGVEPGDRVGLEGAAP
jgi:uncharacterized membrane protein (UPF0127 family)